MTVIYNYRHDRNLKDQYSRICYINGHDKYNSNSIKRQPRDFSAISMGFIKIKEKEKIVYVDASFASHLRHPHHREVRVRVL